MNEVLKSQLRTHLSEMVLQAMQVNHGMKLFYRAHASKENVWGQLNLNPSLTFQAKLERLFPNQFRVEAGLLSFTEQSNHEKALREQERARKHRLELHIVESQNQARLHFKNHRSPTVRNQPLLLPLRRKSRGKNCPTCGVKMSSRKGLFGLTIEHIVPVRFGGKNAYDGEFPQCVGMCWLCNQSRNEVVRDLGIEAKGKRKKISDQVIRFLISQVHDKHTELNDSMLERFDQHYQLLASQETPVGEYDLWGDGEGWVEYTVPAVDEQAARTHDNPEPAFFEHLDMEPVHRDLEPEEAIRRFEDELKQGIAHQNRVERLYTMKRVGTLLARQGGEPLFRDKIGMPNESLEDILYTLFPQQFIVQTKGRVRYIHALQRERKPFYDFEREIAVPKPESKLPLKQEEKPISAPLPPPLHVLYVRDSVGALFEHQNQSRLSLESIEGVLDQLRRDDGEDWESYTAAFEIGGTLPFAEQLVGVLNASGFTCHTVNENGTFFVQFSLPHSFTASHDT
ncbi:MAG: HNH endonuclease [Candidatus Poseidoniaceae archaeon]|nr:HNH endonuclease [Candidatus Poseidoniaceae archaeon]